MEKFVKNTGKFESYIYDQNRIQQVLKNKDGALTNWILKVNDNVT